MPDGVNWEAYSHDELYQMLWQDADVADVSTVAGEWAKHRTALSTHAEVLREQCVALRDSWEGPGAEEAASRLETLAARVEKISELALAGGQAAQEAADALATARAMMPAPPGTVVAPFTDAIPGMAAVPAMPASSSTSSLQSYMSSMQSYLASMQSSFSSTPTTAGSTVGSGGSSFYFGAATQDMQKAQAVQAMQTYESRLASSGELLGDARSAVPAAAPLRAAEQTTAAQSGVPWQQLVGGAPTGGLRAGGGTGAVTGGLGATQSAPLGPGGRVGAIPGLAGMPGMRVPLPEVAATRGAGHGGMVPPVGQRGPDDDEQHENRMPTLDHRLFDVEVPTIAPVIGLTGGQA